ncbi:hypothetical protein BHE74_00006999 [Ensete ventricosum]|nr:hypothetical protein BHE74_00006999 [Ensete ventricosum]
MRRKNSERWRRKRKRKRKEDDKPMEEEKLEEDGLSFNKNFQDPMISKMILSACNFGCSEEIITIAAVLSVQVIFCSFKVKLFPCERCLMFMDACSLFGFLCGEHRRNLMK